jgi:poly(3-hydroxybutyrate) depolymerase
VGPNAPVIPPVSGQCPNFSSGNFSFMNSAGILAAAGTKPPGPTAPMVLFWHGTVLNASSYATQAAAIRTAVVAEGGIIVSPNTTLGGDLRSGTSIWGQADYALADQLVACAVRDYNVDPRRIYTTGCSAGGLFATAFAQERSNYVAAAAPNSGGTVLPVQFQTPNYTPALMTIHGAPGVDVVGVDFSNTSKTADTAFKNHGGFVINCNHGGGHCAGTALMPSAWEFFKAHPYGVSPEPYAGGLPAGFSSACQIF